jgi:thiol-disulfide isomerase/thioredoxin
MIRNNIKLVCCGLLGLALLAGCKAPETPDPTPGLTSSPTGPILATEALTSPSVTFVTAYPGPTTPVGTVYPEPVEPIGTVYPLPISPSQAAYPEPTGLSAYPGSNDQGQTAYPDPSSPYQPYPNPTQSGAAYPGSTQPADPVNTAQPTATLSVPSGTATPTSVPIPTNTPLPTATPAPTVTPTPELPAPIRTELSASDPDLFRIGSGDVQLVEFFAYWCVTCRSMAPTIHSLEALYGSRMNFIYLDIDDPATSNYKQALGYRYQPQFLLLDQDGKVLKTWVGRMPTEDLRNAIDAALR